MSLSSPNVPIGASFVRFGNGRELAVLPRESGFDLTVGAGGMALLRATLAGSGTVAVEGGALVLRIQDPRGRRALVARPAGSGWLSITETLEASGPVASFDTDWVTAAAPDEVFSPHLVPGPRDLVGRHALRAPALTVQAGGAGAALILDVETAARHPAAAMNLLRADGGRMLLRTGLRPHRARPHVFYEETDEGLPAGPVAHSYEIFAGDGLPAGAALSAAARRVWARWGSPNFASRSGLQQPVAAYADQAYDYALRELWRGQAITLNHAYPGDAWLSSWWNFVRTAEGLDHFGRSAQARAAFELALKSPRPHGLFDTVCVLPDGDWRGSSPQGGGPGIHHLMDMSWTAHQLLRRPEPAVLELCRDYAGALVKLLRPDGSLPAWVESEPPHRPVTRIARETLMAGLPAATPGGEYVRLFAERFWPEERFVESAEDAASLLLLAELARAVPQAERTAYLEAASRIAARLEREVVTQARWMDFEVYFSCSPKPLDFADERSGQPPQNTLCMHHAAAGLLALHQATWDAHALSLAQRVLDRLSMYQQVWSPPWLSLKAFGGYAVQNTDGEWNDARQAQFAETHLDFHLATGDAEQLERAVAAAEAAFATFFVPANAAVYPAGWSREPRGAAAENHGHSGQDELNVVSGFDWGAGSALAAAAYFERRGFPLQPVR